MVEIISKAIAKGQAVLSEYDSKQIIAAAGLAVNREKLVRTREDAVRAAKFLWEANLNMSLTKKPDF